MATLCCPTLAVLGGMSGSHAKNTAAFLQAGFMLGRWNDVGYWRLEPRSQSSRSLNLADTWALPAERSF